MICKYLLDGSTAFSIGRIFKFRTGKIIRQYDERSDRYKEGMAVGKLGIDLITFNRRLQRENNLLVWLLPFLWTC